MSGKKATAPCGHPGIHVIGQYIQCPKCDTKAAAKKAVPTPIEDEATKPQCKYCGSSDVVRLTGVNDPVQWWICRGCVGSFVP